MYDQLQINFAIEKADRVNMSLGHNMHPANFMISFSLRVVSDNVEDIKTSLKRSTHLILPVGVNLEGELNVAVYQPNRKYELCML